MKLRIFAGSRVWFPNHPAGEVRKLTRPQSSGNHFLTFVNTPSWGCNLTVMKVQARAS